jgi:hypothetical protein
MFVVNYLIKLDYTVKCTVKIFRKYRCGKRVNIEKTSQDCMLHTRPLTIKTIVTEFVVYQQMGESNNNNNNNNNKFYPICVRLYYISASGLSTGGSGYYAYT